jgi:hypothetical protein
MPECWQAQGQTVCGRAEVVGGMTRKWTLRSMARWFRYFFEPCMVDKNSGSETVVTYSDIHAMGDKTIPQEVLKGLGTPLPANEARVLELLSAAAWRLAAQGCPRTGLIDAGFVEQEGLAQPFGGDASQAILETRAYIKSQAWRRRDRSVMMASIYFERGRACHVLWTCEDDGRGIGFSIMGRVSYWIRLRFVCYLLGWRLAPPDRSGTENVD